MKNIIILLIILCLFTSFTNDTKKKTYWLASCIVVSENYEISVAEVIEANDYPNAKKIFERYIKSGTGDKRVNGGIIDKHTYMINQITRKSILK